MLLHSSYLPTNCILSGFELRYGLKGDLTNNCVVRIFISFFVHNNQKVTLELDLIEKKMTSTGYTRAKRVSKCKYEVSKASESFYTYWMAGESP